jgi:hypothetical protein
MAPTPPTESVPCSSGFSVYGGTWPQATTNATPRVPVGRTFCYQMPPDQSESWRIIEQGLARNIREIAVAEARSGSLHQLQGPERSPELYQSAAVSRGVG